MRVMGNELWDMRSGETNPRVKTQDSKPRTHNLGVLTVLLLFLTTLAFAPPPAPSIQDFILQDWKTYAILAAVISATASVLLLMISRVLDLKHLESTFKSEMVFAGSTVFLVMLLIAFIEIGEPQLVEVTKAMYAASHNIPPNAILLPADTKLVDIAKAYLRPVASCAQQFISVLYLFNIPGEAHSTMYQEIYMSEQATGGGSKPFVELMKTYTKTLTFYMLAYYVLIHLLNFIKHYALFFLTVGVVLRAFPPTRGAGAYIMALSLGLYFVFPFTYMFMSTLAVTPVQGLIQFNPNAATMDEQFTCNTPNLPEATSCGAQNRWKVNQHETWQKAFGDYFNNFLNFFGGKLTQQLTNNICLLPMMALIAVLTFVINTTTLFGGSIPEIGRGLVKLI